jgi:membrane-bound serine protease (ClpP class)
VLRAANIAAVSAVALFLLVSFGAPADAQGGNEVLWVRISGVIGEGTALHVRDAIEEAEQRNVPLVLELNTPGGLVDSTLDIDLAVAGARIPVLAFVGPASGFAASAGTFILLMGQPTGMAPSTSIGSAQPITVGPDGSTQAADDKVVNFLVGRIRAIAERTGRDADVAERFVTENLNLNRTEAERLNMVDLLADDVESFVRAAHGMTARTATGSVVLDTENARLVSHERGVLAGIVDILSNPQIAFILILIGTYALIFGLANPGTYVPETIGALLLLLGLIGLGLFTTSTAGILLLLLAIIFFVAEVFTPTQGILSAAGVIALLFSVVFLVDEPLLPGGVQRTFYFVGIALAILSGGAAFFAATIALKTRRAPARDSLIGKRVLVVEDLAPSGRVSIFGEIWSARTNGPALKAGTEASITGREGLTLIVEETQPSEPAATR